MQRSRREQPRCHGWLRAGGIRLAALVALITGLACQLPSERGVTATSASGSPPGTYPAEEAPRDVGAGAGRGASPSNETSSALTATQAEGTRPQVLSASGNDERAAGDGVDASLERIDRERFRRLVRMVPETTLDGRDDRAPYGAVQRFLRALMREDAEGWQSAVHLESPLVLGPLTFRAPNEEGSLPANEAPGEALPVPQIEPASFSLWRSRLGRFRGLAGWGVSDWEVPEVAVFLAPVSPNLEYTVLRLRPERRPADPRVATAGEGQSYEARSWRVYWLERTFEPETIVPRKEWVLRRFDDREAQPRYGEEETVSEPRVTEQQLLRWFASVVADARAGRLDGVRARVLSDDERRATAPPGWELVKDRPSYPQERIERRLARILQAPLPLETMILLDQYQVRGSRTVFVHSLVVLGEPHQMRQIYRVEWRLAQGLYKIAHIEAVPLSPALEVWLEEEH